MWKLVELVSPLPSGSYYASYAEDTTRYLLNYNSFTDKWGMYDKDIDEYVERQYPDYIWIEEAK